MRMRIKNCLPAQAASVFVFEKRIVDRVNRSKDKETVSDIFRLEVTRLLQARHPRMLSVLHPVEESR
jgi:SCY1-like protein 2